MSAENLTGSSAIDWMCLPADIHTYTTRMNARPEHIAIDMRPLLQQQQQQQQQYADSFTRLSISSPLPDMYRPAQQPPSPVQQLWTLFGRLLR
jgi:hypothetical protein